MKKRLICFLLAVLCMIGTAGCQSATTDNSTTQNESPQAEEIKYRDTLNVAVTAQPPTLDPPKTVSQVALNIALNFYETLYTQDENFQPQPLLAESYEVNEQKTEYTFKLRQGVQFHNGEEMKAEDVAASMNYWLQTSSRAKNLLGEGTFEVVDDYTVKATFAQPTNDLITLMSARPNFPAIRTKEAIEAADENGVSDYNGTGPYIFKEWKQDQYIHLVRNENYSPVDMEPSGFAGRKTPFTENIYYQIVPDAATRIAGMISETYDVTEDIPTENFQELKKADNLNLYTDVGGTLTLFFNVQQGVLSDVNMRKAIVTGINNDEIMMASFVEKELYTLDPGYMNPNMVQWSSTAGSENYNVADPEKAKEMLAAAGYQGQKIRLLTTPDYAEMYNATIVLQEQLRQMGMDVEVLSYDFPTFMDMKADFSNWDIFITSNGYQVTPQQLLVLNPDWAGANDPQLTEMIKEMRIAATPEEAKAKWDEIQGFLYNEYVSSIAIGQYMELAASNKKVENFVLWQAPIVWNAKVQE